MCTIQNQAILKYIEVCNKCVLFRVYKCVLFQMESTIVSVNVKPCALA